MFSRKNDTALPRKHKNLTKDYKYYNKNFTNVSKVKTMNTIIKTLLTQVK